MFVCFSGETGPTMDLPGSPGNRGQPGLPGFPGKSLKGYAYSQTCDGLVSESYQRVNPEIID